MDFPDYDLLDEAHLRAAGGLKWTAFPGCIGAFVAEMDFGTAPPVARAMRHAIASGRTGYPSPALARELAEACAQWHSARHGWSVAPERIHAVGDVLGGLELVLAHFVPRNAPVVLPTPLHTPFTATFTPSSAAVAAAAAAPTTTAPGSSTSSTTSTTSAG